MERFLAETDILVGFRHPNILNVYGVITDNLLCFQHVLEFADAGDLSDFLGDLSRPEDAQLAEEIRRAGSRARRRRQ